MNIQWNIHVESLSHSASLTKSSFRWVGGSLCVLKIVLGSSVFLVLFPHFILFGKLLKGTAISIIASEWMCHLLVVDENDGQIFSKTFHIFHFFSYIIYPIHFL